jgi:hypothetical protein
MAHNFGSLVFTPVVKALQERYGNRRQYARRESPESSRDRLVPDETAFIAESDSFYMATVGATGWPYIQRRWCPATMVPSDDGARHLAEDQSETSVPFWNRISSRIETRPTTSMANPL